MSALTYLATPSAGLVREAMRAGELGQLVTPNIGNRLEPGVAWALDNGTVKLVDGRPVRDPDWTAHRWLRTLERYRDEPGCLFAVVPDWVGDAALTNREWVRWQSAPRRMGYRVAYVLQDGCSEIPVMCDAVFIGGSTDFKLSARAREAVALAKASGKWVHMGRVNSLRRLRYAHEIGCDSADGTFLTFGPNVNMPRLRRYMTAVVSQPTLDLGGW